MYPDHPALGAGFHPELTSGIYQMRPRPGGAICVCEKFYEPSCQTQPGKIPWQNKFAAAVENWQALTLEQKMVYRKRAVGKGMSGYNLFIRDYMHG